MASTSVPNVENSSTTLNTDLGSVNKGYQSINDAETNEEKGKQWSSAMIYPDLNSILFSASKFSFEWLFSVPPFGSLTNLPRCSWVKFTVNLNKPVQNRRWRDIAVHRTTTMSAFCLPLELLLQTPASKRSSPFCPRAIETQMSLLSSTSLSAWLSNLLGFFVFIQTIASHPSNIRHAYWILEHEHLLVFSGYARFFLCSLKKQRYNIFSQMYTDTYKKQCARPKRTMREKKRREMPNA